MCIKSAAASLKEFSPGDPSMARSASPAAAASTASTTSAASETKPKKVHSYQNVTCNADTRLFQLSEKAEAKKEAASEAKTASKTESQAVKKDMVSLQLSGGCLMDQKSSPPIMIIHHHHHHFYPNNQTSEVISKPVTTYQNLSNIHETLRINRLKLEESGWYHGKINLYESTHLLKNTEEGTFLVRDSADPRFLFTLSVQRAAKDGPTSVRIHFSHGKFRLDADQAIEHRMPVFDSVNELVEHYQSAGQKTGQKSAKSQFDHLWVDNRGQLYSPILLKQPLMKEVPTLKHLARMAVHKSLKSQVAPPNVWVPKPIKSYLCDYPHVM